MTGSFIPDHVPAWTLYADIMGLQLKGRGRWGTTRCDLHGGNSLRFNVETGGWKCMGCGAHGGDTLSHYMQVTGCDFVAAARALGAWSDTEPGAAPARPMPTPPKPPAQPLHVTLSDYGRQLWADARPLAGEAVAYLQARQCVIPPRDGHLRWHPALKHPPSGTTGPALVALVTDALSGEPLTMYRGWVQANGRKADLDPPRMLLGGHRKAGGVIRLWPDEAVTLGLGVAEGIETALSLAHAFAPVWAAIDAGNLASLPVLGGVESLLIAADNDESGTGQRAANALAQRWADAGREAAIVLPPALGMDLNDLAVAA
jgi:hypothetical protein